MAEVRVGVSGWTHDGWRGTFYPKGTPKTKELELASRSLDTLEINATFYALQRPKTFQEWYAKTPDAFVFSVKAPQFITHVLRLNEAEEPLSNFLASGLLCLKEKQGPILWQFPPHVTLKDDRFERFVKILPHDTRAAAALAREHGPKLKGRAWTEAGGLRPVRHAFEFRHPSFRDKDFLAMLGENGIAVVDSEGGAPARDFVYLRLFGDEDRKTYSPAELAAWAKRIAAWKKEGRDVFAYFGGEVKDRGPFLARELREALSEAPAMRGGSKRARGGGSRRGSDAA